MRLYINLIMVLLCLPSLCDAQKPEPEKRISVHYENVLLEKVIVNLEERYKISFSYSSNIVPVDRKITIDIKNKTLEETLDEIFSDMEVSYQVIDDLVILKRGVKKRKTGYRNQLNGAEASVSKSLNFPSDTVYKKEKAALSDSIKVLKSEVQKLNKIIDSLIVNEDNINRNTAGADTTVVRNHDKKLLNTLRKEMNELNMKIIKLLDKLSPGQENPAQDSDSLKNESTHYYIIANIVPGKFNYPLIGLVNLAKGPHSGCNVGYINLINGDLDGVQAGFLNINNGNIKGVRLGYINIATGSEKGVSLGFMNLNNGAYDGTRLGFVNVNKGDFHGVMGGFVNYNHGNFDGFRCGFINVNSKESKGTNLGVINISHKINGFHLGFINIADSVTKGVPIGFLTIVKNGYRKFEIGASEVFFTQASFKIGVKRFYNIFSIAANYSKDQFRWGYGYGIGTLMDLPGSSSVNIDLLAYDIFESGHQLDDNTFNMLYILKANYAKSLGSKLSVYVGPSFNVMVSTIYNSDKMSYGSEMPVWTVSDFVHNNTSVKMWPGINAGIRF